MTDFDLVVARSVAHALEVLQDHTDATIVAGATDLIPLVRSGRWHTRLAVDITRLDELRYIKPVDGGLEIGALTTHAQLTRSPLVQEYVPVLAEAAACVAGPQVQARATMGGNICTASPAADTVPALLVLDAVAVLISPAGERRLPLSEFLTGPGQTVLRPGEMLKSVHIPPVPEGAGMAFEKMGKRKALVISVVNAAALLVPSTGPSTSSGERPGQATDGFHIGQARLALGAVAPTVVRCGAAEEFLIGKEPGSPFDGVCGERSRTAQDRLFAEAADLVQEAICPIDDVRASAAYRRVAAVALARRTLVRAWGEGAK